MNNALFPLKSYAAKPYPTNALTSSVATTVITVRMILLVNHLQYSCCPVKSSE